MQLIAANWIMLLITFSGAVLTSSVASGFHNKLQGHDFRNSAKIGFLVGIATGLGACLTVIAIEIFGEGAL